MRRLGFQSDAGYRFERGVDFELGPRAVERATQLILEICGGRAGPLTDVRSARCQRVAPVRVRSARVTQLLGIAVSPRCDRRHLHATAPAATREAATTSSSRRRRTDSTSRSRRTSSRRSRAFTATTRFQRRRAAHVQTMLPSPEARRSAFALRARARRSRLAGNHHVQLRRCRRRARARPGARTRSRC